MLKSLPVKILKMSSYYEGAVIFLSTGTLNVASASVVLTMSCAKEIFHLIIFQAHKGAGSFHH